MEAEVLDERDVPRAAAEEAPAARPGEGAADAEAPEEHAADGREGELLQILAAQDGILDCMLTQQKKIHASIRGREWLELEKGIDNMRAYSDAFVSLDQCRESFVEGDRSLYLRPEVEPVFVSVRSKLSRSKIENSALATYVSSTREFIDGIIDACVPQRRNTLYTRAGKVRRPVSESVVLDTVM